MRSGRKAQQLHRMEPHCHRSSSRFGPPFIGVVLLPTLLLLLLLESCRPAAAQVQHGAGGRAGCGTRCTWCCVFAHMQIGCLLRVCLCTRPHTRARLTARVGLHPEPLSPGTACWPRVSLCGPLSACTAPCPGRLYQASRTAAPCLDDAAAHEVLHQC